MVGHNQSLTVSVVGHNAVVVIVGILGLDFNVGPWCRTVVPDPVGPRHDSMCIPSACILIQHSRPD
jgi:hypothetical protein